MKLLKNLFVVLVSISLLSCSINTPSNTNPGGNGSSGQEGDNSGNNNNGNEEIKVTGVSLSKHDITIKVGSETYLSATVTPDDATDFSVAYRSNRTDVATVEANGKVTAVSEGSCIITVITNDGGFTDTCNVKVISNVIHVDSISLNKSNLTLNVGDTYPLQVEIAPSNAENQNVTFSSSNESVATISNTGVVSAVNAGTSIIVVTSEDDSSIYTRCFVTVKEANQGGQEQDPGQEEEQEEIKEARMQDTPILHCWNWSMSNIESRLSEIKAAGFKTIQLSPMQPQKDYYTGSSWSGQWWKLYQPLGLKIAESGQNVLGTKAQLKNVCDKAEALGIDVIMDVVTNHLAGGSATSLNSGVQKYESEIYSQNLIHTNGQCKNWENPQQLLTYALGSYPDLQTENTTVQSRVLSMLKEYIDCGVDGFRFDAAKHIETPDDGEYASNYWPIVIDGVKEYAVSKGLKEPYIYGELLNTIGTGRQFSSYTKYMSVTDSRQGSTILSAIVNKSVNSLTKNYVSGVDPSQLVLWAESHDTYANDSRETTDISIEKIHKAYLIQTSRKDASTLYFSRPKSNTTFGSVGEEDYKGADISAINAFHNTFVGQDENIFATNGCFVNERGTTGMVIVGVSNTSNTVSISTTKLKDGRYLDLISNQEYDVSSHETTVTLNNNACVLINVGTTISSSPSINVGSYNEVFTGSQDISVNISNATTTTYSINNGTATTLNGNTVALPSTLENGKITLKITASNATDSVSKTITLIKTDALTDSNLIVTDMDNSSFDYLVWAWSTGSDGAWYDFTYENDIAGTNIGTKSNFIVVKFAKGTTTGSADWGDKIAQTGDLSLNKRVYSFSELVFA